MQYLFLILMGVSAFGARPDPKEDPKFNRPHSEEYCREYCGNFYARDYWMCAHVARCELVVNNEIKACVMDCEGQSK